MLISDNSSRPGYLTGPHRGTKADIDIWRQHKPPNLHVGERGLADGAYQSQDTNDTLTCVLPRCLCARVASQIVVVLV
jgi:hypothetical protein